MEPTPDCHWATPSLSAWHVGRHLSMITDAYKIYA
jgi:hypothetical protein